MAGCTFCQIVGGDGQATVIAEEARVVAIMDLFPVTPGHALVIPRHHAEGLADLDAEDGAAMFRLARRIGAAQKEIGIAKGVNLLLYDGAAAGQTVLHAHLHIIPRNPGDGRICGVLDASTASFGHTPRADGEELETGAAQIREAIGAIAAE